MRKNKIYRDGTGECPLDTIQYHGVICLTQVYKTYTEVCEKMMDSGIECEDCPLSKTYLNDRHKKNDLSICKLMYDINLAKFDIMKQFEDILND